MCNATFCFESFSVDIGFFQLFETSEITVVFISIECEKMNIRVIEHSHSTKMYQTFNAPHACATYSKDKKLLCHSLVLFLA